jgi:membrane protease YdiL (CAAX protease family)
LYLFTGLYYTRYFPLQILSFVILLVVAFYWGVVRRRNQWSWRDFKLTKDKWVRHTLIAAGLAIFGWGYFSLYNYLTRGEWIPLGFGGSYPALFAIITVATAEEVFFRGYVQNRLAAHHPRWRRVLLAVVALALFKNVVHMWEGLPVGLHLELFFLGVLHNILASYWMEWSDSLVGPLLLHVFWDLLVYAPLSAIPYWVI